MTLSHPSGHRFSDPSRGFRTAVLKIGVAVVWAAMLAGCQPKDGAREGGGHGSAGAASAAAASVALRIAPEDLHIVGLQTHATGPVITGTVEPERRADLRAELSAVVLQVFKDNGQAVRKGDVLVRLDDTSIRDSLQSAEAASRAAGQALEQAQRQYERMKTLQAQGMSSMQALEDAEARRNAALSERAAADARTVAARQQLQRTQVRAPFEGIVSEREVSAGDTAAVGKALLKVIDPASMRLNGRVPADRMGEIQIGQQVQFRVNGYSKDDFVGKVRHVDAAADPVTREVAVIVDFAPGTAPRMAGLYAEGRVAVGASQALVLAEAAVVKEGDKAYVWKIASNTLAKTPVTLGERDARRGEVVIRSGIAIGDKLLRVPGSTLVSGQKVQLAPSAAASAPQA